MTVDTEVGLVLAFFDQVIGRDDDLLPVCSAEEDLKNNQIPLWSELLQFTPQDRDILRDVSVHTVPQCSIKLTKALILNVKRSLKARNKFLATFFLVFIDITLERA